MTIRILKHEARPVELHVSPRLVSPEPAETFQSQPKLPVWGTTAPISKPSTDLLDAQYGNPVCVIGFNAAEGWSHDVWTACVASTVDSRHCPFSSAFRLAG